MLIDIWNYDTQLLPFAWFLLRVYTISNCLLSETIYQLFFHMIQISIFFLISLYVTHQMSVCILMKVGELCKRRGQSFQTQPNSLHFSIIYLNKVQILCLINTSQPYLCTSPTNTWYELEVISVQRFSLTKLNMDALSHHILKYAFFFCPGSTRVHIFQRLLCIY